MRFHIPVVLLAIGAFLCISRGVFAEEDVSARVMQLEQSLANIEREQAVAVAGDNTRAQALLAEVHEHIALTLANLRSEQGSLSIRPNMAANHRVVVHASIANEAPRNRTVGRLQHVVAASDGEIGRIAVQQPVPPGGRVELAQRHEAGLHPHKVHERDAHQPMPHQSMPYQPMPYQPMPHQPMPHQPMPHQPMYGARHPRNLESNTHATEVDRHGDHHDPPQYAHGHDHHGPHNHLPMDHRTGPADPAQHLRIAAKHLDMAGYESMANKARAEAERLMRKQHHAQHDHHAQHNHDGHHGRRTIHEHHAHHGHHPLSDRVPPQIQRIGRAMEELRREMKQLRKEIHAVKRHAQQAHHGKQRDNATKQRRKAQERWHAAENQKKEQHRKAKKSATKQKKEAENKRREIESKKKKVIAEARKREQKRREMELKRKRDEERQEKRG